jgi:hypothetical protein
MPQPIELSSEWTDKHIEDMKNEAMKLRTQGAEHYQAVETAMTRAGVPQGAARLRVEISQRILTMMLVVSQESRPESAKVIQRHTGPGLVMGGVLQRGKPRSEKPMSSAHAQELWEAANDR